MDKIRIALLLAAVAGGPAFGQGAQMTQPSANQNQSQLQANQVQQPKPAKTKNPTADSQNKPNQHPELAR